MILLHCLRIYLDTSYRMTIDLLKEMSRIRSAIDLKELPPPSTLCKAFNRLDMMVRRVLLDLSVTLLPTNGIVGIDASGLDRSHASKHYTKAKYLPCGQRYKHCTRERPAGASGVFGRVFWPERFADVGSEPEGEKGRCVNLLLSVFAVEMDGSNTVGVRSIAFSTAVCTPAGRCTAPIRG